MRKITAIFILVILLIKASYYLADADSERPSKWNEDRIKETIKLAYKNEFELDIKAAPGGGPGSESRPAPSGLPQSIKVGPGKEVLSFEVFNRFDSELFGSLVLTWANFKGDGASGRDENHAPHLGGEGAIVAAVLRNVKKGETYRIEVRASKFLKPSSVVFVVSEDAELVTAGPTTIYDYDRLGSLTQTSPFDVSVVVQRDQENPVEMTQRWQAHQINDCPTSFSLLQIDKHGEKSLITVDNPRTIAGFVNENHPWIDTILAEALNTGYCRAFTGYADGEAMLGPQIAAIWQSLQNRRISYSNIATSTKSNRHAFQHVRFFDETIKGSQANCLDGSVMLASILRKIGINVGVILVPGHAYVVVYDAENKKRLFAVETTMLRNSNLPDAVQSATDDSQYALAKVWRILNEHSNTEYAEINITDCRQFGIQPIPYWRNGSLMSIRQPSRPSAPPGVTPPGVVKTSSSQSHDPAYTFSPISVDSVAVDQERYLNARGIMTSAQLSSSVAALFYRLYDDKYRDGVPPERRDELQRVDFCKQQWKNLEQIESVLRTDPSMFIKFDQWQETVNAINKARQAFNARPQPPRLVMPPDDKLQIGEKEQIRRAYEWSLRTLLEIDPWDGNHESAIDQRRVPAIIERTKKVCQALTLVSQLPLEY